MRWLLAGVWTLAIVGGSCAACEEEDLGRLEPFLEFEPTAIDYGPRNIEQGHVEKVVAKSRGTVDLFIEQVRVEPASAPFVEIQTPTPSGS